MNQSGERRWESGGVMRIFLRSALSALLSLSACKVHETQQIGDSAHGKQLIDK